MFLLSNFSERVDEPHGQIIHVEFDHQCDEWVILDWNHAINLWGRWESILMQWRANAASRNVHWEWECHG
jgi:hypothetical protein